MSSATQHVLVVILMGCVVHVAGCSQVPLTGVDKATIGRETALHTDLLSLPRPRSKTVVAVYKFRDQTGQYKASETSTTFSTAVTQGATAMLNKALEDSGWFTVIERESLNNLLNERKIINSTRATYKDNNNMVSDLPPLLYAGVLLEGGIISYDTNILTGGGGVRYFGAGGFGNVRKDQVTIYLRLISVKNGQILKTVNTTKSILSREVDFGVYRFVRENRLLEMEAGYTTNEPVSMCVLEAVEKAVLDLIIEGVQDEIWEFADPEAMQTPVVQNYLMEKEAAQAALSRYSDYQEMTPKNPMREVRYLGIPN